jgi:hypothetical protein
VDPEATRDRVVRIRELEASADHHERVADRERWEAAELIAAELDSGKSMRQLGAEIGKSHTHVRRMAQVWRDYGGNQVSNLSFNTLYRLVQDPAEPQPELWKRESPKGRPPPLVRDRRKELRIAEGLHGFLDDLIVSLADPSRDPAIRDAFDRAALTRMALIDRLLAGLAPEGDPEYERWEAAYLISCGKTPKPLRKAPPPSMRQGPVVSAIPTPVGRSA